jgi:hypothetical protein
MHQCDTSPTSLGSVNLAICADCSSYKWTDKRGVTVDSGEAITNAYGSFILAGILPYIGAPGGQALIYQVPRRFRSRLAVLPVGTWIEIHPGLFATQDGASLLLAPADPAVSRNLHALG